MVILSGDLNEIIDLLNDIKDNQELILSTSSGDNQILYDHIDNSSKLVMLPLCIIMIFLFIVCSMR